MNRIVLATGIAAAAATSLMAGTGVATAAPARPVTRVISDCQHARYEPKSIILTCGDADQALTKMTYSRWTDHTAAGKAVLVVDDCTPNCAAGKPIRTAVGFELTKPTAKTHHFSRLVMTYKRHGKTHHETVELVTTKI